MQAGIRNIWDEGMSQVGKIYEPYLGTNTDSCPC